MKRISLLCLFALAGLVPACATPGFKVEYLQPPLVINPTGNLVQATSGSLAIQPTATMVSPLAMPPSAVYSSVETVGTVQRGPVVPVGPRVSVSALPDDCNLQDVCRRLQALEASRSLAPRTSPEALPMPQPKPAIPMPKAPCD